jgi:hypothetical protein
MWVTSYVLDFLLISSMSLARSDVWEMCIWSAQLFRQYWGKCFLWNCIFAFFKVLFQELSLQRVDCGPECLLRTLINLVSTRSYNSPLLKLRFVQKWTIVSNCSIVFCVHLKLVCINLILLSHSALTYSHRLGGNVAVTDEISAVRNQLSAMDLEVTL